MTLLLVLSVNTHGDAGWTPQDAEPREDEDISWIPSQDTIYPNLQYLAVSTQMSLTTRLTSLGLFQLADCPRYIRAVSPHLFPRFYLLESTKHGA